MSSQFKLQLDVGTERKGIEDPAWDQVHQALLSMDGDVLDQVSLDIVGIGGVLAGGGNQGRYVVIYAREAGDEPSLTLTDLSETGPDVWLQIQTTSSHPARICVRLPLVLNLFEHFFHRGELPNDVRWEFDNTGIEADLSSPRHKSLGEQEEEKVRETRRFFEGQGLTFAGFDGALIFKDEKGSVIRVNVTIGPGGEVEYQTSW